MYRKYRIVECIASSVSQYESYRDQVYRYTPSIVWSVFSWMEVRYRQTNKVLAMGMEMMQVILSLSTLYSINYAYGFIVTCNAVVISWAVIVSFKTQQTPPCATRYSGIIQTNENSSKSSFKAGQILSYSNSNVCLTYLPRDSAP